MSPKVIELKKDKRKLLKIQNPDDSNVDCISAQYLKTGALQVLYSKKEVKEWLFLEM